MASAWGLSWARSWGNAWGLLAPAPDNLTRGGFDERKYREYLERLNGIRQNDTVEVEELKRVEKLAKSFDIDTPKIKQITKDVAIKSNQYDVDYSFIAIEVNLIYNKIALLLENAIKLQRQKQDEEAALVLMLSL